MGHNMVEVGKVDNFHLKSWRSFRLFGSVGRLLSNSNIDAISFKYNWQLTSLVTSRGLYIVLEYVERIRKN